MKHSPVAPGRGYGGSNTDPPSAECGDGVEILVATPGRLLDHVQQRTVNLGQVTILVLDEADRMLDMGFMPDIKRILALLPAKRQNMLFSATFQEEIRKLAPTLLTDPAQVQVAAPNAEPGLLNPLVTPVAREKTRNIHCHNIPPPGRKRGP